MNFASGSNFINYGQPSPRRVDKFQFLSNDNLNNFGEGVLPKRERFIWVEVLEKAYQAGEEEETLEPRVLVDDQAKPIGRFQDGDYLIFYNLRGEREVELCQSLLDKNFSHFKTNAHLNLHMVTMIPYHKNLPAKIAFPREEEIRHTLSETLSKNGLRQVKISESEKAVHVGYFFNGKNQEPFPGEERIVVPTPKDVTYLDQKPEMNAAGVAEAARQKLAAEQIDFILVNFANIDVVGHFENEKAVKKAVETVDYYLGQCLKAAKEAKVISLITADHGTVEKWLYADGSIDTGHTDSPVPFVLVDHDEKRKSAWKLLPEGELGDVAPTILELFKVPQPDSMTGRNLIKKHPPLNTRERILLIILDGWGYRKEIAGNLIAQAQTPVMDNLIASYPFTLLKASGEAVGLPERTVGNSEAGHMHIGAGRRIKSDRLLIDQSIANGTFFENEAFLWAMRGAKKDDKSLHLLGIVSFFSSHGSVNHLISLLKLAKRESLNKVYVHALLGRRGEHKQSGAQYLELIEREMKSIGLGQIVSVIGRYWALDREENWDRVEKAYRLLVYGEGKPVYLNGN